MELHNVTSSAENYTTFDLNEAKTCDAIKPARNSSYIPYAGGFEILLETLLIDVACWLIMLCIFSILSEKAWSADTPETADRYDLSWIPLFYGDENASKDGENRRLSHDFLKKLSKGYFFWLRAMMKIRDRHVLSRCGLDAVRYLSFQRHIILFLGIVTCVNLLVVFPVNFQGELEKRENYLSRSSMANLDPESQYLWTAPAIALIYIFVCMMIMKSFSDTLETDDSFDERTLMIKNIPKVHRDKQTIRQYIRSINQVLVIENIQFAFDVKELMNLTFKKEFIESAILWCENKIAITGKRPTMNASLCFSTFECLFKCCCKFKKVDALELYLKERNEILVQIRGEERRTTSFPLGICFVTFRIAQMVHMVLVHEESRKVTKTAPTVADNWIFQKSPSAKNIFWENLAFGKIRWILQALAINLLLLLFSFFMTTPNIVLGTIGLPEDASDHTFWDSMVTKYIPSLLLLALSLSLPLVIAYSDLFVNYSTRSVLNLSMMIKTYVYLIFMIVILPTIELTSVNALMKIASKHTTEKYRWECIFLPDNGLFFAVYLLTSAFIGTTVQLMRLPELIVYKALICLSRSDAEIRSIRKAVTFEYEFGLQYAYFLLNVSIVVIFGIASPVVAPCGLLYVVLKHFVDRYNIYFGYSPLKISKSVHIIAINLLICSFVIQQLFLLAFTYIRSGFGYMFITFFWIAIISLLLFLVQMYLPELQCLRWMVLPHNRKSMEERKSVLGRNTAYLKELKDTNKLIEETESGENLAGTSVRERLIKTTAIPAEEDDFDLVEMFFPDVLRDIISYDIETGPPPS